MVYSIEEFVTLVDAMRERGVTYFKCGDTEVTLEAHKSYTDDEDVEVETSAGMSAEDILYYSAQ